MVLKWSSEDFSLGLRARIGGGGQRKEFGGFMQISLEGTEQKEVRSR